MNIQRILKENPFALPPILRAKVGDSFARLKGHPQNTKEWAHTVINDDGSSSVGKFELCGSGDHAYWTRVE